MAETGEEAVSCGRPTGYRRHHQAKKALLTSHSQ